MTDQEKKQLWRDKDATEQRLRRWAKRLGLVAHKMRRGSGYGDSGRWRITRQTDLVMADLTALQVYQFLDWQQDEVLSAQVLREIREAQ